MADALLDSILAGKKNQPTGDPLLDSILDGGTNSSTGDPLLDSIMGKPKKDAASEENVAALEQMAEETGAPGIAQQAKGLGMGLVDLLSRANYASAGAADKLFQGDVGGAIEAVPQEILSGIPGFQGQKKTYAQVLEENGIGSGGSLSSILPFMYSDTGEGMPLKRGGAFDPTARGAAGLGLDIALDPLTYLTAGSAKAGQITLRSGTKYLSKKGIQELGKINDLFKPAEDIAMSIGDASLRLNRMREIRADKYAIMDAKIVAPSGRILDPTLLDPGGIKLFGHTVIPQDAIKELGGNVVAAMKSVPGGEKAIEGATAFAKARKANMQGLFGAFPKLNDLPPGIKQAAVSIHRDAKATQAAVRSQLFEEWAFVKKDWDALVGKNPDLLGKKFYDIAEKTGQHILTPKEQDVYNRVVALYKKMEDAGLQLGIVKPDELLGDIQYLQHAYKNADQLPVVLKGAGKPIPSTSPKFLRERDFKTFQEALDVTTQLEAQTAASRAAGGLQQVYPKLQPDYDAVNNLASHINQFSDAVARKQWREDAVRVFGQDAGKYDIDAIYDMSKSIPVSTKERGVIDLAFSRFKGIRDDAEWSSLVSTSRRLLPKLSDDGKREYLRELVGKVNSPSQVARVNLEFGDDYGKYFPRPRSVDPADVDTMMTHFGEKSPSVQVSGGYYPDNPVIIPKSVYDDMENFSTKLLKNKEIGPGLKKMLDGYDFVTNWFKTSVYSFWVPSAVRDVYNNVAQSFLRIGVGALARPAETAAVLLGKGEVKLAGRVYEAKALKQMAEDLLVMDKSGRAFAQLTGEKQFKPSGAMAKVLAKRGQVDNFTRTQLWLNAINEGMDPRAAADTVREFLFDYSELSPFEREFMRRAIPFYTFPRKAIELHMKAAVQSPGRVINELKPFRGRDDENGMMTSWEGQAFKMRLDRDGKTVTMITGVDFPIRTLDTLWTGTFSGTIRRQLGMLAPIPKIIIEAGTGASMFTGKKMDRVESHTAGWIIEKAGTPKAVQNWLGYKKEIDAAGRVKYTFDQQRFQILFQSWVLSRVLSTSERQFRTLADDNSMGPIMLDVLTGLRYKEMNMDEQKAKMLRERLQQLRDSNVRRGNIKEYPVYSKPKVQPR